ncbi:NADPH:quinone oxidoreductase family protein [Sphingosinicella microcystinivorans]|uniref:NADPH2:quinone reductase n=1 Tax=Sphingosinicella microcystinivorans TaxID=335406 RepID=A0AAD1G1P9_SPHMI|nr:NADPH:quinone oxidoreductase family protein [Sphingosinicella microcystinivorans]RKS92018.1 NADPH2:quinone reductase [Sphingosinicella microcystinivorans]BBE35038.1 NADPH:quinone oxidoreductase [Sphingosinicella microcystinivorans]
MKAWVCHALSGDRAGLRFETEWPDAPPPASGEVRVALTAAGLNFPDLLMLSGGYQFKPALPFVPGVEGVGVLTHTGAGVDPSLLGRRVVVRARSGCLGETITLDAGQVRLAPDGFSDAEAASYGVGALTAWVGLVERGRLMQGETLLVTGAGGGMGLAAVALGKACGAHVIAAASGEAKLAAARTAGADETVALADLSTLKDRIDVVFDPVGGALFASAVRTLRWNGRYLLIGFAGGIPKPFALNYALIKGIEIVGVRAGEFGRRDPEGGSRASAAIDALVASSRYRPFIGMEVPLERADEAFAAMAAGALIGKAVVRIR